MATTKFFAVFLKSDVPTELTALIDAYFQHSNEVQSFLLCSEAVWNGAFLSLTLLKKGEPDWKVQIPTEHVLMVAEIKDISATGIGFVR